MAARGRATRAAAGIVAVTAIVALAAVAALGGLGRGGASPMASSESTRTLGPAEPATSADGSASSATGLGTQGSPRSATPVSQRKFDAAAALADVRALESFGVRTGGTPAEAQGATYLRDRLAGMGLQPSIEEFPLPNGATSRNVIARIPGSSDAVIVLGAHMDSKSPSPGANDNATGCGALLQIAAIFAEQPVAPTVEIVFFGSEETIGSDPNGHHFGSRYFVSQMSAAERASTAGMISVDMIGYGPTFASRTMGKGPKTLSDMLLAHAQSLGVQMTYLKDTGKSGWSDHEAFELAGMPVAWIEWRDDPVYHTAGDTSGHLSQSKVDTAGSLVLDFLRSLDASELASLSAR